MNRNKAVTINTNRQAIAGMQKHFANTPTMVLDGTPTTPTDAIATLQAANDAIDRTAAAEKAFHDAVAAKNAALAKGNVLVRALRTLVTSQIGSTQGVLGDFGFSNPTRQTPDEPTKAAAVVKRAATRAARHTLGKRQKASIKGVVQATPAIPPTATKPA
jgi:hypothetical protein